MGGLEREAAKCQALEKDVVGLKEKVAELPEVVTRERKVAVEEALAQFHSLPDFATLHVVEYDRGFEAGYTKHFHILIEKGWINIDKYYADMEQEERERQQQEVQGMPEVTTNLGPKVEYSNPPGGDIELI